MKPFIQIGFQWCVSSTLHASERFKEDLDHERLGGKLINWWQVIFKSYMKQTEGSRRIVCFSCKQGSSGLQDKNVPYTVKTKWTKFFIRKCYWVYHLCSIGETEYCMPQQNRRQTKSENYFLESGLKVFKRNKEKHMEGTVTMQFPARVFVSQPVMIIAQLSAYLCTFHEHSTSFKKMCFLKFFFTNLQSNYYVVKQNVAFQQKKSAIPKTRQLLFSVAQIFSGLSHVGE